MERVRVLYDREGPLTIAVMGPVVVTVARGEVTSEFLREAGRAGRELSRSYPKEVGSLALTSCEVPLPDPEIRSLATKISRESDSWVKAAVTVVDGSGFKASVIRSLLVTMTMFQGGPPRRVYSEVEPAVDWLAERLGLDPPSATLLRAWCTSPLRY